MVVSGLLSVKFCAFLPWLKPLVTPLASGMSGVPQFAKLNLCSLLFCCFLCSSHFSREVIVK